MNILSEMSQPRWTGEEAQDIAEYAVMSAAILVIVVSVIRRIGSNSNNVFSKRFEFAPVGT